MTQNPQKSTPTLGSPFALQSRLTSYALAAGAAGVGVLALAAPSQAEVVYTPTHVRIPFSFDRGLGYKLDVNGDGVPDFQLVNSSFGRGGNDLVGPAAHGNLVIGMGVSASALTSGASIGPDGPFAHRANDGTFMAGCFDSSGSTVTRGPWVDTRNRYLDLKFLINGEYHFGWARISIDCDDMLLTGYAYETVANKPIIAGQQSGSEEAANIPATPGTSVNARTTLGSLALGSAGFVAWRKPTA